MAKIPGLIQRGLTYFVRVRVPKDLKPHFEKGEIVRTLETRDYSAAIKRIHVARSAIEAEFEKKRQQLKAQAGNTDMLSGYSDNALMALAGKWLRDVKAEQEKSRAKEVFDTPAISDSDEHCHYNELKLEEWKSRKESQGLPKRIQGVGEEDIHKGSLYAEEFLEAEGVSYNSKSEHFQKVAYFFSKAIHEFAKQNLDEYEGKRGALSASSFPTHAYQPVATQSQRVITMGGLVQEYLDDPKVKRGESVLRNYRLIMRAIQEVIGNDVYAHQVTRGHCQAISALMLEMPSNVTKKIGSAKRLADAVKIGKSKGMPKISAATYNNYMQNFSAIMDYAVREMYITQNPAKKLFIKDNVKKKDKRDPFTLGQLKKIFSSDVYGKHRSETLLYKPNSDNPTLYGRYWIPLIGLWTGMRLNEICQLHISDIDKIDGIFVILIRDTDEDDGETEKRVKTESGIRFIPVHPVLERVGLFDFIASVRKAGATRLFPDIKLDSRGYYTQYFSKRFSDHLKDIDAKTAKTSFHSFRHTYRDAVRAAKLPRDAHLALGGWSSDATDDLYGCGLGAKDLHEELCKITYKGLELSHLYK